MRFLFYFYVLLFSFVALCTSCASATEPQPSVAAIQTPIEEGCVAPALAFGEAVQDRLVVMYTLELDDPKTLVTTLVAHQGTKEFGRWSCALDPHIPTCLRLAMRIDYVRTGRLSRPLLLSELERFAENPNTENAFIRQRHSPETECR